MSHGGLLLSPLSVLLLDGAHITIRNLRVDGALVVRAVPGARVVIDGLSVSNKGWAWTPLEQVNRALCLHMLRCCEHNCVALLEAFNRPKIACSAVAHPFLSPLLDLPLPDPFTRSANPGLSPHTTRSQTQPPRRSFEVSGWCGMRHRSSCLTSLESTSCLTLKHRMPPLTWQEVQ